MNIDKQIRKIMRDYSYNESISSDEAVSQIKQSILKAIMKECKVAGIDEIDIDKLKKLLANQNK